MAMETPILQLPSWLTPQELTDLLQRVDAARSEVVKQNRALTVRCEGWVVQERGDGKPRTKWVWVGMDGNGFSRIIY